MCFFFNHFSHVSSTDTGKRYRGNAMGSVFSIGDEDDEGGMLLLMMCEVYKSLWPNSGVQPGRECLGLHRHLK